MSTAISPTSARPMEERLHRAQEAYREYYGRCFWHMKKNLIVTEENFPVIIEDLKLYGNAVRLRM